MWHDLIVTAGRALPPLARLHDHRNLLIQTAADLERRLSARESELTAAKETAADLERRLSARESELTAAKETAADLERRLSARESELTAAHESEIQRRASGFTVDFDYPYLPKVRTWTKGAANNFYSALIASGFDGYREFLASLLEYKDKFNAISAAEPIDERQPYWSNLWLPSLDAICLSGLVTKLNPKRYVEVGSGNSTKYIRRAISDHGLRTKIISIDPHPRAEIDTICDEVIREKLEDCDLELFSNLGEEDVLFIDNSHRSFQNSDVTVFFTEILPRLKSGCHYGIHDIFLPNDYPLAWLSRYYNEQYLLMAYLLGGAAGDQIVAPVHFIEQSPELLEVLSPILGHPELNGIAAVGGAFWLKRN